MKIALATAACPTSARSDVSVAIAGQIGRHAAWSNAMHFEPQMSEEEKWTAPGNAALQNQRFISRAT